MSKLVNQIYWERQRGNNCRIHSLNAFFGYNKISDNEFEENCNQYDKLIPGLKSINMDGFAECRSIISFIVDNYTNKFVQLIPINLRNVHKKNRDHWQYDRFIKSLSDGGIKQFFEFNRDHIWFNSNINNQWYKIDSISGITEINKPRKFGENGYLLIFEESMVIHEIDFLINFIHKKIIEEPNVEIDIAIFNLFHLLKRLNFKYSETNTSFNQRVSFLKTIFSIVRNYVEDNRKIRINKIKIDKYILELKRTILSFY
jgi:hypothetical protein